MTVLPVCYFIEAQRSKLSWHPLELHKFRTELLGHTTIDMHEIGKYHKKYNRIGREEAQILNFSL